MSTVINSNPKVGKKVSQSDLAIIGGGIAGISAALRALDAGHTVTLIERGSAEKFGGLAKKSFGGINIVGSPIQKRSKIQDRPELAYEDWCKTAHFGPHDHLPKLWAKKYVEESVLHIYEWLSDHGVKFFPVVHWVERGLYEPGNSVPRFHMVWGTGQGLIESLVKGLGQHPRRDQLEMLFDHEVQDLLTQNSRVIGCRGQDHHNKIDFEVRADATIIACGGIAGSFDLIREHWNRDWGTPPPRLLNGSHHYADGAALRITKKVHARVTNLHHQWNYAAGVHHPKGEFAEDGLSLVPPRSALWVDSKGKRLGPMPLITGFDTRHLVETICRQPHQYSWQILNKKIAIKELAISGSEHNQAIRDKNFLKFIKTILFGNRELVDDMMVNCVDFVVADNLDELVKKMNELEHEDQVDLETLRHDLQFFDSQIERGSTYHNDEQLRRLQQLRQYRGDRARTCNFQKILDPSAGPLIAIREFILTRKSLGGLQTDLNSRVLNENSQIIEGLYAIGEAAGFGGGGIHGQGSLEGTFLGSCLLTSQSAIADLGNAKKPLQAQKVKFSEPLKSSSRQASAIAGMMESANPGAN